MPYNSDNVPGVRYGDQWDDDSFIFLPIFRRTDPFPNLTHA